MMPSSAPCDFRSLSPFRPPAWRWLAALEKHHLHLRRLPWEDAGIVDAARFLKVLAVHGDAAASRRWPELSAAHAIFRAGGILRDQLEAQLLTGRTFWEISTLTGIATGTVKMFESVFFNVAQSLDATTWILDHVICFRPGEAVSTAQVWKFAAITAGPVLLDLLIDEFCGRPHPNPADRSLLVAKAHYMAREHAAGWHSLPVVASLLDEFARLFPHLVRRCRGTRPDPLFVLLFKSLRAAVRPGHRVKTKTKPKTPAPPKRRRAVRSKRQPKGGAKPSVTTSADNTVQAQPVADQSVPSTAS